MVWKLKFPLGFYKLSWPQSSLEFFRLMEKTQINFRGQFNT